MTPPFLYQEKKYDSKVNGELILRSYLFGGWYLKVKAGEYYSGSYLEKMWLSVLKRLDLVKKPEEILILGLGAGSVLKAIQKYWPKSKVTAVDYDPTMIELAKQIYGANQVNCIISDALVFLKNEDRKFDLIVIDIFLGNSPSPLLSDEEFIKSTEKSLNNNGMVIANIKTALSQRNDALENKWQEIFPDLRPIKYQTNKLIIANKNFIPADYCDIFQSEPWVAMIQKRGFKILKNEHGFYAINKIVGLNLVHVRHAKAEPDPEFFKKAGIDHGIIFWSPWGGIKPKKPWRRLLLNSHQKGNGFSILTLDYKKKWSENAKRNLKKFLRFKLQILETDKKTFNSGLKKSTLTNFLKAEFGREINEIAKESSKLWIAKKDEVILGGLAVVNYDQTSAHFVAYLNKKGKRLQVGVGLIDYWSRWAVQNKIKYLNFGNLQQEGEAKDWRGYSEFKRKFVENEIMIPYTYFRFF